MTLTVRIAPDLERKLEAVCKRRRVTKSAVVTTLIQEFITREPEANSYEIAERLGVIGSDHSAPVDVAARAKQYVRRAISAKHRRRYGAAGCAVSPA